MIPNREASRGDVLQLVVVDVHICGGCAEVQCLHHFGAVQRHSLCVANDAVYVVVQRRSVWWCSDTVCGASNAV